MDSYSKLYHRVNRQSGFAVHNHIQITKIAEDHTEGELTITPESLNPMGVVHGGCLVALADSVAGTAVHAKGRVCVTLSSTFNYLIAGTGSKIKCVATPQRIGRTIAIYDVVLTADQERKVATGCFTFYRKDETTPGFEHLQGKEESPEP